MSLNRDMTIAHWVLNCIGSAFYGVIKCASVARRNAFRHRPLCGLFFWRCVSNFFIPHFRIKCQNMSKIFITRKSPIVGITTPTKGFFFVNRKHRTTWGGRSVSPMPFFIPWIFYHRFCIQRRRHVETVFRHDVIKILSPPQVFNQTEKM